MAVTLLQHNKANVTGGATTLNCAFLSAVTPGSMLVCYAGSTASNRTFTASDGVNGAYTVDINTAGGQGTLAIMTFPNTAAGTPTVTATISGAVTEIDVLIEEWSGVNTVTPFDKSASNGSTANTTGSTGTTATLSQTNELCLAFMHLSSNAGTTTPFLVASPFTANLDSPNPASVGILGSAGNLLQASTAGVSATFNWTNSVTFRGCIATYTTAAATQQAGSPFSSTQFFVTDQVVQF